MSNKISWWKLLKETSQQRFCSVKRDDTIKLETMDSSFPEGSQNESNDGDGKTNQLISSAQNHYFSVLLLSTMILTMI